MTKKIEAIVREEKLADVKDALRQSARHLRQFMS